MFSYQKRLMFPVYIEYPDKDIAHLLQQHYVGNDSEFAQFTRVMFQHLHIHNPYLRDLLGMIAAEELGHLELVTAAIKKLGGREPLVNELLSEYPDSVSGAEILKGMKENEEAEERAIKLYTKLLAKTDDFHLKRILQFLINREDVHRKIFSKIIILITQEAGNEQFAALIHEYKMSLRVIS